MTEKRFENRLDKSNVKFNTLNPVWDNKRNDALNLFEMIDLLNELNDENEKLRLQLNSCSDQRNEFHRGARENANRVGKLKKENLDLSEELDYYKSKCASLETGLFQADRENEELKENCKNYNWYKQYKTLLNENEQLKSENNMLKVTIGRNESYIKKLTETSEWHC